MAGAQFVSDERHGAAWAVYVQALNAQERLVDELPESARQSTWDDGEEALFETDDPRWIAAGREANRTSDTADDAACDLLDAEIRSTAGAVALLRYAVAFEVGGNTWPEEVNVSEGDDPALDGQPWHVWLQSRIADFLESRV
jgi:hypothetical protein